MPHRVFHRDRLGAASWLVLNRARGELVHTADMVEEMIEVFHRIFRLLDKVTAISRQVLAKGVSITGSTAL